MTEAEELELLELEAEAAGLGAQPEESTLSKIITPVAKTLDYVGGVSRAAVANRPEVKITKMLSDYYQGKEFDKDALRREADEMLSALKANPKSSAELLEARGVGEMGSVDLPFVGKTTGRGVLGFASDVATDPLNAVGVGPAAKFLTKAGGKKLFQSGLKKVDQAVLKAGKEAGSYSDTLLKYGISGSAESMMNQSDELAEALLKRQQDILDQATKAGAVVDSEKMFGKIIKQAEGTAKNKKIIDSNVKREAANFADDLKAFATENKYIPEKLPEPDQVPMFFADELPTGGTRVTEGVQEVAEAVSPKGVPTAGPQMELLPEELFPVTEVASKKLPTPSGQMPYTEIQQVSGIGKGQQSLIRPSDVMPAPQAAPALGGLTPADTSGVKTQLYNMLSSNAYDTLNKSKAGDTLIKQAAHRAKTATEAAVRSVDPALARELREVNKDLGTILTGKKAAFGEFSKEVTKNAVTPVDTALAWLNPSAAIAKKAGDLSKMPGVRTGIGQSMYSGALQELSPYAASAMLRNAYQELKEKP